MLKNLASGLILTERDSFYYEGQEPSLPREPSVKGRVITTLHKAKEVRPLVEKCVTIARKSLQAEKQAEAFATDADRGTEEYRTWRNSDQWQQWAAARAPVVTARRRAMQLLGDKEAVGILFDTIAPRFADRDGGYTRILRLATPRLGDAGVRAVLEFVGQNDRVQQKSEKPAFSDADEPTEESTDEPAAEQVAASEGAEESAE